MTREGRTVQPPLLSSSSSSPHLMDAVFQLDNNGRQSFLQFLMQSSGAAYTCLWSYLAPASCLCSIDGYYQEQSGNPSSSSGSLARRLFEEYKKSLIIMENNHGHIPGFAYWSNNPYFETREDELWKMATNNTQRQFYQEARIKLVVFMGCVNGEIELGFSNMLQVDLQMQMRNLFPEDFSRQNPRSSSSSSMDSPEYSSLLFNLPAVGFVTEAMKEAPINPTIQNSGQLQVLQALSLASNLQFPTPGSEHDVMAKAFLAVISSPSSSSSSSQQMQNPRANPRVSAFGPYFPTSLSTPPKMANIRKRQNPMNRAIAYFRGLHLARPRDRQPLLRVANTQLHHMMSERKRREKLNDSFLALKALLPSGTKKDKASILTTTREYLTSLRNRIDELREINAALEARLSASKAIVYDSLSETISDNRFDVRIRHIEESTSSTEDHRVIELQVIVRGECPSLQLTIFILEFVKKLENVQMMGVDSGTRASGSGIVNRVNLRLRIEGNEWDESAFEEAVKRIVADVAR